MSGQASKQKGRRGEHEVAAALEKWWRALEPNAVFMRTPSSGGFSNARATGLSTRGDVTVDPTTCFRWPFSVEVKLRKTITAKSFENFEAGKRSPLTKYWQQCIKAATRDNMRPLLVARGDRQPWRVAFEDSSCKIRCCLLDVFISVPPEQYALPVGADR